MRERIVAFVLDVVDGDTGLDGGAKHRRHVHLPAADRDISALRRERQPGLRGDPFFRSFRWSDQTRAPYRDQRRRITAAEKRVQHVDLQPDVRRIRRVDQRLEQRPFGDGTNS